jgi:alpha-1,3-rhamnosyltransferase
MDSGDLRAAHRNSEPLVSVCVPVYNHEKFVEECIRSIIDQDYKNIELIVIDDGSTDDSVEVIKQMISACEGRFVRFEFITRPNKGACATLNEAIAWSRGEFFAGIASDDAWYPQKTSAQVQLLRELGANVAAVSSELQPIDDLGNVVGKVNRPQHVGYKSGLEDVLCGRSRMQAPTAIIRMSALRDMGGYNETLAVEDLDMWLKLTSRGYELFLSPQVLGKYRIHGANVHKKVRLMHHDSTVLIEQFAPNDEVKLKALQINLDHFFATSAILDKGYAVQLLLNHRLNIFRLSMISPMIFLITPQKYISRVQTLGREVKRLLRRAVNRGA